ncbi:MAG: 2-oxoglutarate dehydrogenase complex dihydrolipoyllysine-residue succinyltransferase [Gemmataceae bacterium]
MPVDVKVPEVGESITEGVIVRWLKQTGDAVRRDEPLLELETEKATSEIPAPTAGTLNILVEAGKKVLIGSVIASIDESKAPSEKAEAKKPAEKAEVKKPVEKAEPAKPAAKPATAEGRATPALSPAARVMVAEKGIDASAITPTGRGKTIVKDDVLAHEDQKAAFAPEPVPAPLSDRPRITRQPMTAMRRRIAERLVSSQQTTATLTTFNEADMSAVMELRNRFKDKFKEKHGVGLGFMSFFVKACVEALKAFPVINGRIDGDDLVFHNFYDISIAVSSEKGLTVPVLRGCDRLSFSQVEKGVADLAAKARDGKLKPDELTGGTFTITNGGIFGSMMSTPILNPPQSAILGMHAITKRPVVVNDQIVIRPMMYLALSYDHRIIDGRDAVLFLVRVKECVENPERLLLEV